MENLIGRSEDRGAATEKNPQPREQQLEALAGDDAKSLLRSIRFMTPRRALLVLSVLVLITMIVLGDYLLRGPHEKLLASAEQKNSEGYRYWVTVRQNSMRFRVDLFEEGARSKLLISSREFYEGSLPITNVLINWPALDNFSVAFQPSLTISCSWSQTAVNWSGPR